MRSRTLLTIGVAMIASFAVAEDGYRHGRLRFAEPGVSLQRATEVSTEEAAVNTPFLPGDRVFTDAAGRAEFQFPDGTVVRLDARSKLDYSGHEEGAEERIVLRLWSGSAIARVRGVSSARFEIETPAGTVEVRGRAVVRADVEAGELRLSVSSGEAVLDDGRERTRLAAGERTFARWGAPAEEPRRFDFSERDDFARWDDQREAEDGWAVRSSEYLPDELDPYAGEFERNGSWQYEASAGYVWVPRVAVGWQPYWNGRWAWTPYGWTWIAYDPWGWAPFHYGRWGLSVSFGWYWIPGRTWGPGWVSWAVGGGHVGWCPLGWRNRPVVPWHHRGHAVPRGRHGYEGGWSVVRQGDLGHRDVARRRVGAGAYDPSLLRVADSPVHRPTRDGLALRESDAAPRAISRRPRPGDFVRELGVDNRTTIPAPWTRGYGSPPAGVEGARYGAERRDGTRRSETGRSTAAQPYGTEAGARRPRPTPWTVPSPRRSDEGAGRAGTPSERTPRAERREASERTETVLGGWWRSRRESGAEAPSSGRAERSRGGSESRPSGVSRAPRLEGGSGGERAPRAEGRSGGVAPRPPRGEARSGGGSSYTRPSGGGSGGGSARPSGGRSGGSHSGAGSGAVRRPRD
jgi:hypothetical protein